MVDQSIADRVAGVDERSPSVRPDDSVDRQASLGLEVGHGPKGANAEDAGFVWKEGMFKSCKSILDIPNGRPAIAPVVEPHKTNSGTLYLLEVISQL